jgi:hypothetical protein
VAGGASVAGEAAGAIALKITALVFVADDGYTAEVTLAEVQVKGVVEIQVK